MGAMSLSEYSAWPRPNGFAFSRGGADVVGYDPTRRRQRRMKANPSGPSGLALQGASAALRGLDVESTTPSAAPCIRSLAEPTRLTRNTQTGSWEPVGRRRHTWTCSGWFGDYAVSA